MGPIEPPHLGVARPRKLKNKKRANGLATNTRFSRGMPSSRKLHNPFDRKVTLIMKRSRSQITREHAIQILQKELKG